MQSIQCNNIRNYHFKEQVDEVQKQRCAKGI
jgi:hypothetical protein